jgi:hypothetical protein
MTVYSHYDIKLSLRKPAGDFVVTGEGSARHGQDRGEGPFAGVPMTSEKLRLWLEASVRGWLARASRAGTQLNASRAFAFMQSLIDKYLD